MGLKEKLKILADKQYEIAKKELEGKSEPEGLNDLSGILSEIFRKATNDCQFRRIETGSDLINESIPLQLMTQPTALRDLTIKELEPKGTNSLPTPFNMPLNSLVDLARTGHLYLNLMQYDYDNDDRNEQFFKGQIAETLEALVDRLVTFFPDGTISSKIYIMSALRKPVFNKMIEWTEGTSLISSAKTPSYLDYYQECLTQIIDAEAACREFYSSGNNFTAEGIPMNWRGRTQENYGSAFHYAYLKSASKMIKRDFKNEDIDIIKSDYGFDTMILLCADRGKKWRLNNTSSNLEEAARSFAKLAHYLRVEHVLHTVQITGAWGCVWNRPFNEYLSFKEVEGTFLTSIKDKNAKENNSFSKTPEFQKFIATLLKNNNDLVFCK